MARAADLLFGKIVIRNQLATENSVRDCFDALVRDPASGPLADLMVRRGLLAPVDAEKARHAAALAQAQRYIKFGTEMGLIPQEAAAAAIDEFRRRRYQDGIGRVLMEMRVLDPAGHRRIVDRDPRILDDDGLGLLAAAQAPPAPPAGTPVAPRPPEPAPGARTTPPPRTPPPAPLAPLPADDRRGPSPPPAEPVRDTVTWSPPPRAGGPEERPAQPLSPSQPIVSPPPVAPAPQAASPPAVAPPPAAGAPVTLRGGAREFTAIAIRDGILSIGDVRAALSRAPESARSDSAALADALVAARVLARSQARVIEAAVELERDGSDFEIEGYYLVAPLGFGAYGPVILARRTHDAEGRPLAQSQDLSLEVLPAVLGKDARREAEFRRRCGYLPSAVHPALAKAVDTGISNGALFVAREHPAGVSLAQRIAEKPLPERDALDLAQALADALGALAFAELVHGALRPENIVLTPDGRWILRYTGETPVPPTWDPETAPPTVDLPRWISPEAVAGGPVDPRSEMYTLGLILFFAVTGKPPYDGPSPAAIIAKHLEGRLPDPVTFGVPVSPRFLGLLRVLTQVAPEKRYRDYVELAEDLEGVRAGGTTPGMEGDPEMTLLYPEQPPRRDDESDRTMVGSTEEDADLKEMRRLAAERRARTAASAAGLLPAVDTGQVPVPGDDPLSGLVLSGRYRILKKLGAGGMGTVYLAEHLLLHKSIAVKILHPKLLENLEAVARFDREVKASSRFQHSGVVQIFDAGEDVSPQGQKLHYMVMEYVEGEDLHRIIEREGALPLSRSCNLIRQVLSAVDEAHKKGIVHRDMKSDNIMVCKESSGPVPKDVAKIMDFGIAKILETDDGSTCGMGLHNQQQFRTRKGVVTGTPQYMSPEQASGDPNIDGRSDIYSIGIIFYEMCIGELPFKSNTAMGYLGKHIIEPPIPPKEARPDLALGADLERVILRCLEKPRERRYQTASEMLRDLEATVFPTFLAPGAVKRARRPIDKKKLLIVLGAAVAAILFVLVVLGVAHLRRARRGRPTVAQKIAAAEEALARGDLDAATAALAGLKESDAAVKRERAKIGAAKDEAAKAKEQKRFLEEGNVALGKGDFEAAFAAYQSAQKNRSDETVTQALSDLNKSWARSWIEKGDNALAKDKLSDAKLAYGEARAKAPTAEVDRKIALLNSKKLAADAKELGATKDAVRKYREALFALPLDDSPYERERLKDLESAREEYKRNAGDEERRAYHDELLKEARASRESRRFRYAGQCLADAQAFGDVPANEIIEISGHEDEEKKFLRAKESAQRVLDAGPAASDDDRRAALTDLDAFVNNYKGSVFADDAKALQQKVGKTAPAEPRSPN